MATKTILAGVGAWRRWDFGKVDWHQSNSASHPYRDLWGFDYNPASVFATMFDQAWEEFCYCPSGSWADPLSSPIEDDRRLNKRAWRERAEEVWRCFALPVEQPDACRSAVHRKTYDFIDTTRLLKPVPVDLKIGWLADGIVRWTGRPVDYKDVPDAVYESLVEVKCYHDCFPATNPEDANVVRTELREWLRKYSSRERYENWLPLTVQNPLYEAGYRDLHESIHGRLPHYFRIKDGTYTG